MPDKAWIALLTKDIDKKTMENRLLLKASRRREIAREFPNEAKQSREADGSASSPPRRVSAVCSINIFQAEMEMEFAIQPQQSRAAVVVMCTTPRPLRSRRALHVYMKCKHAVMTTRRQDSADLTRIIQTNLNKGQVPVANIALCFYPSHKGFKEGKHFIPST